MNNAQIVLTFIGGVIGTLFGKLDGFLIALIVMVCMDYLTGVLSAIYEKKLNSEIGAKGICKKVAIFCLVAVAHIIDAYVIKDGSTVRTAVIFFYLSNEGISILENASKMGLPVPNKLKKVLEQLKEDDNVINSKTKKK